MHILLVICMNSFHPGKDFLYEMRMASGDCSLFVTAANPPQWVRTGSCFNMDL